MGLFLPLTRWIDSDEYLIHPSNSAALMEGQFLVEQIDINDGNMKVLTPTGVDTEIAAGVCIVQRNSDTTEIIVEQITFPALAGGATTVATSISNAPLNPTTDVLVVSLDGTLTMTLSDANLAAVVANTAGYFNSAGNVINGYQGWAGVTANVTYRRNVSLDFYHKMFGDPYQGLLAADITNSVGVVKDGVVYTNFFKSGDDWPSWNGAAVAVVGDGGFVTMASGATGAALTGAEGSPSNFELQAIPTVDVPYLGVRMRLN